MEQDAAPPRRHRPQSRDRERRHHATLTFGRTEHALTTLLGLNGLRVSEATAADIEHLGLERGHRTLTITRKGGKVVTIPLAPHTARAIDWARGSLDRPATYIVAAYVAGAAR